MTRRSPVPRSLVLLLFLPVVVVVGFAFSWARNAESSVKVRPAAAIAYSPR
jgi:hypothetical protein